MNCLLHAASLWPAEVVDYLLLWHRKLLSEVPKPEGKLGFGFY